MAPRLRFLIALVGAALLWPSGEKADIPLPFQNAAGGAVTTETGHVLSSTAATCGSPSAGSVLLISFSSCRPWSRRRW